LQFFSGAQQPKFIDIGAHVMVLLEK